jgi:G3E family GTPase
MAVITHLPVTVLGGYLGAGKTTLVNHLLRHADGRRIAVAVNDFGALPIDSDLIEGAEGNVLTLSGGCICCTFGSDLVAGLMELAGRADTIDHILIEASGVALPGAIAQSLSLVAGLSLDAVVVVVDAETVQTRANDPYMADTITRQLADADLLIVNKIDLIAGEMVQPLQAWLALQAPTARLVRAEMAAVAADVVLGHPHRRANAEAMPQPPHATAAYDTASFAVLSSVNATRLAQGLANPALGLVRAKGVVRDSMRGWVSVNVVGKRTSLASMPESAARTGRIVCITHGRRIDQSSIAKLLKSAEID